jgi:hypothetical protein
MWMAVFASARVIKVLSRLESARGVIVSFARRGEDDLEAWRRQYNEVRPHSRSLCGRYNLPVCP